MTASLELAITRWEPGGLFLISEASASSRAILRFDRPGVKPREAGDGIELAEALLPRRLTEALFILEAAEEIAVDKELADLSN